MRSGRRVDRRSCCGGARHEGAGADRARADGRGHVMQFGREHRMVPQVAGRQMLTVLISEYSADIDTVNIRGATTRGEAKNGKEWASAGPQLSSWRPAECLDRRGEANAGASRTRIDLIPRDCPR